MAYNNYLPNYFYPNYPAYQPMQQTPPQMTPQVPSQPQPQQTPQVPQIQNGGFISVRSEIEARNYPVAPGNSVTFFDENNRFCYTKTCVSQLETPRFDKYRLVKEEDTPVNVATSPETEDIVYATKEQIQAIEGEIQALKAELANLQKETPKTEVKRATRTKKESDEA